MFKVGGLKTCSETSDFGTLKSNLHHKFVVSPFQEYPICMYSSESPFLKMRIMILEYVDFEDT